VTAYVFAGPTIQAPEINGVLEAVVLPPVAMGDVYRLGANRPKVIGIIDGYFEGVPSVWHKEILWAMTEGIPVFGAASMGALRAAELHAFGMRGVGKIFEGYRDGTLEDDDEVAVHHGPAVTGYVPLSEPMVNIRATLGRALEQDIVTTEVADHLINMAKSLFYPERNWETLLACGQAENLPIGELKSFRTWLPEGRIDQKLEDALVMLEAMARLPADGSDEAKTEYHLEWTVVWDKAKRSFDNSGGEVEVDRQIVDELRLDPDRFYRLKRSALGRLLAERVRGPHETVVGKPEVKRAITQFRSEQGLFTREALEEWLKENDIDGDGLEQLIGEELQLAEIGSSFAEALNHHILCELRMAGAYGDIARRARRKQQVLEDLAVTDQESVDAGVSALELRLWFFKTRLERPVPDDLDRFIRDTGHEDRASFDRMLAREFLFTRETAKGRIE